eukprot:CAMPEP_0171121654 /NCGR_PEP_ID=MMETSP0766_2-20121228/103039_1 /TAXON_ID=439317 /ORGANISM="Gambierdiscus australes, Strain CAWD 149" /LENGTH=38 /DNA_ID= /DNA_START= /DNA_END= /DNA_ORIENTATION=
MSTLQSLSGSSFSLSTSPEAKLRFSVTGQALMASRYSV